MKIKFQSAHGKATGCFLVPVHCNSDYHTDCNYLYFELSDVQRAALRRAKNLLTMGKDGGLDDVHNITLWCRSTALFLSDDEHRVTDDQDAVIGLPEGNLDLLEYESGQPYEVEPMNPEDFKLITEIETSAEQIRVTDNGFYFVASLDDGSELWTEDMPFELLAEGRKAA